MDYKEEYIVEVNRLQAGYAENRVINDVSFKLSRGELCCLMGPNGAGKSTLLRCISGLQRYEKGKVSIMSKDLMDYSPTQRAHTLSLVLTEYISAAYMSVYELISLGRYPHMGWMVQFSKDDKAIIKRIADRCGVSHLLNKKLHELSDGQRQKTLIARSLIQQSDLIILDEPTSHLDLNNRVEIINLLKDITREEGKAIFMATHELDLALQMADRLLLLNSDGKLKEGIPEDLVLSGKLDEVFAFKGYDLKTGRVEQQASQQKVSLSGDGHIFLWTKNALEREGFTIDSSGEPSITFSSGQNITWFIDDLEFLSLAELISFLKK